MKPILQVRNLEVTFRKDKRSTKLVDGVSFDVYEGRCLGILGESGSGKSMTVKAIFRLLDKSFTTKGDVHFKGIDMMRESSESIRKMRGSRITMVLQNPMNCFDPLYRIGDQMAETFAEHTDWSRERIHEESLNVLKLMRIPANDEILQKYPHQLSGGMLQRVMIGLAIKLEPDLIVCDEPTTAVDSITRHAIMKEFLRIKKLTKAAMIFISHDLSVLEMISDELLVMYKGRVVERGTPEKVFESATDPYTRELIDHHHKVMDAFIKAIRCEKTETSEVCHVL